jgi:exopolysaccharide biosynthesis WecB/TagA/CpsF family protein
MIDTRVRIFYPADPLGTVPGGVDTFVRGLIKWAPKDIHFSLVGMSTDPLQRPVGGWRQATLGDRSFELFPVCAVRDAGARGLVPLSVRFMAGVNRDRLALAEGFDVFDFHRIEPLLMWTQDRRPKNAFFHQDPNVVREASSDALWRWFPGVYERLERRAMSQLSAAWCVRESGAQRLRERYPDQADRVSFLPTWVDGEVFRVVTESQRALLRHALQNTWQLDAQAQWVVSVGRLDTQKDPMRLVEAFVRLRLGGRALQWLIIGDGVLRQPMQAALEAAGVMAHVRFMGLQPAHCIANILPACDAFALSSAYEGMPMALLEALGSGLPALATDVGEVRRVVQDGVNGRVVPPGDAQALARGLSQVLNQGDAWRGLRAARAVEAYSPSVVLQPVYQRYRELGQPLARLRVAAQRHPEWTSSEPRRQRPVVGVRVDLGEMSTTVSRLMDWAARHDSRTVCFVNVHSAVQATVDERHRLVLASADFAAPDGAPIAWTLRLKGHRAQPRLDGGSTMWALLAAAEQQRVSVGLYGSTESVLQLLKARMLADFPQLRVAYTHAPPFRELQPDEDEQVCHDIRHSGIGLLFVGLGCPRQEYWLAAHRGRLPCVMLGVGAAFDFYAGTVTRAPVWMRNHGLEWLHRLLSEPRRLWRRYAVTNSLFLAMSLMEALQSAFRWLRTRPGMPER